MENKEILKELRSIMGLNRREFAEYFCIPYRTVQEWELAHRNMPDYLLRLMLYSEKLRSENKFYSASKNVSIIRDEFGKNIVIINDIRFKGKRNIDWEEVEKYLTRISKNSPTSIGGEMNCHLLHSAIVGM